MRISKFVIFLLMLQLVAFESSGQEVYNNCVTASEICPTQNYTFNNIGANVTFCPDCEDDFNFCFPTNNTIWFEFTTNGTGGDVALAFSNLLFTTNPGQSTAMQAAVLSATVPCDAATYTLVSTCHSNENGAFIISAPGLSPLTTYYLVVDGDLSGGNTIPAEFTFDLNISGPGIDRPLPFIGIITPSDPICLNTATSFQVITSNCPDINNYTWSINGTPVANTIDTFFVSSALQDGDQLSVSCACYATCPELISAVSLPLDVISFPISAGADLTINPGEAVQLSAYTTAPDHLWSPSFLLSDPTVLNPIANPEETTTFTFSAEQDGCILQDYVTITVNSVLEIPNTFSPNGDDINEFWLIKGIGKYPDNAMNIYNRWGQEIFQASGYSEVKAWGGETKGGGKANEGVYYYVLDLRNGEPPLKGTITLIR